MVEKTTEKKEKKKTTVATRGRTFQGLVTKKFETRVVIEFERIVKIAKYERFAKKSTKLHAKIPEGLNVKVGDYVKVRECRPLSKMIHFMVVGLAKEESDK